MSDPRFGEAVGLHEISGLVVAFKALLVRAGGKVEISESELLHARTLLVHVAANPELLRVEVVEGEPPVVPVFERAT